MEPLKNVKGVDTEKAWLLLKSRLENDGLIPEEQIYPETKGFSLSWKIAASFLVLIVVGSLLYLSRNIFTEENLVSVSTGSDQLTLVKTLGDGSVVYMADNSTLTFPEEFTNKERRVNVRGEVFFDVAPDATQPFIVEAGQALIEVVGTSFVVKTPGENHLQVYVEEGVVSVKPEKTNQRVILHAGESLDIKNGSVTGKNKNLLVSLWRYERMHFKDEYLENIISVINKNFDADIKTSEVSLGERQLTVTFYNNSLPTILELLCVSMNLEAMQQPDSSYVLTPRK